MIFKFSKIYGIILVTFFINSCGLLKESNNIVDYKTKNFDYSSSPVKPNYESLSNWLVHPEKNQDKYSFFCLLYTSPSPRDKTVSRMPSSA